MVQICEVDKFYMGNTPIQKIYAGVAPEINLSGYKLVWPCFDCSINDPELDEPFYTNAVVYLPKVCPNYDIPPTDFLIKDAKMVWPYIEQILEPGPGYNGLWSVDNDEQTWGFYAPTSAPQYDQIIIEEDSDAVHPNIGYNHSGSVSFYINAQGMGLNQAGLLIQLCGLEVHLSAYEFFRPAIKAKAARVSPKTPIEITTAESLPNKEIRVLVIYNYTAVNQSLYIYFNDPDTEDFILKASISDD